MFQDLGMLFPGSKFKPLDLTKSGLIKKLQGLRLEQIQKHPCCSWSQTIFDKGTNTMAIAHDIGCNGNIEEGQIYSPQELRDKADKIEAYEKEQKRVQKLADSRTVIESNIRRLLVIDEDRAHLLDSAQRLKDRYDQLGLEAAERRAELLALGVTIEPLDYTKGD